MKKLLFLLAIGISSLMADFKTIDNDTLLKLQKSGVVVIDIRTPKEWRQTGVIPGAKLMEFFKADGSVDTPTWFFELGALLGNKAKPFIIYCAHANRSKTLGKALAKMGFEHVYELKDGIENGWIKSKLKTEKVPF